MKPFFLHIPIILAGLTVFLIHPLIVDIPAYAGDEIAGKRKAFACFACHDRNGRGTAPHFPHIGGQQEIYLIKQLESFRNGERDDEMMTIAAKSLSDQDIADLAAWYSSLQWDSEAE